MKTLKNAYHDLAGNGFFRVVKINVLNKLIPVGNFRRGIGLRPALVLFVLHYFSKPLFYLLIRQEARIHRLYQILKKRT